MNMDKTNFVTVFVVLPCCHAVVLGAAQSAVPIQRHALATSGGRGRGSSAGRGAGNGAWRWICAEGVPLAGVLAMVLSGGSVQVCAHIEHAIADEQKTENEKSAQGSGQYRWQGCWQNGGGRWICAGCTLYACDY
eukprot:1154519-Pelagomonas_calceolata.AAC.2